MITPLQFSTLEYMLSKIPPEYGVVWKNKKAWAKKLGIKLNKHGMLEKADSHEKL